MRHFPNSKSLLSRPETSLPGHRGVSPPWRSGQPEHLGDVWRGPNLVCERSGRHSQSRSSLVLRANRAIARKDEGGWQRQLKKTVRRNIVFFSDGMPVLRRSGNSEPIRDIRGNRSGGVQTPYASTKRWVRCAICMRLDASAGAPIFAEAKSGPGGDLDISNTAYTHMA
jgi:hypothetical protein